MPNRLTFLQFMGISEASSVHKEKFISAIGGFIGIFAILFVSSLFLEPQSIVATVPSLGATAILLFAVPNVPFAQPWNALAGHLISAAVGVTCALWIPDMMIAAAASVGIANGLMYAARCIHPPGGATALVAVIGGTQIQELGYLFMLTPVLLNLVVMLVIAYFFNRFFDWRRYPSALNKSNKAPQLQKDVYSPIKHEDFVYALSEIDSFVDISEADLVKIYSLATKKRM